MPAAQGIRSTPGALAAWQAGYREAHAPQQRQRPQPRAKGSSMRETDLECAAGPSMVLNAGEQSERPPQSQQEPLVRRLRAAGPAPHRMLSYKHFWAQSVAASLSCPTDACQEPCALGCMQASAAMDQVVLDWGGDIKVVLARVRDAEGCWLSLREVHNKLGSGVPKSTWQQHTQGGKAMS